MTQGVVVARDITNMVVDSGGGRQMGWSQVSIVGSKGAQAKIVSKCKCAMQR
jgi:hypothetical protein